MKIFSKICIYLILGLRPLFGPQNTTCRYPLTCTEYAQEQLNENSLFLALWNILKRVLTCNPFFTNF